MALILADAATVAARNRTSERCAAVVLDALSVALPLAACGRGVEALYAFNDPLTRYQPMRELLAWCLPELINAFLDDARVLPLMPVRLRVTLGVMGLIADWPGPVLDTAEFWRLDGLQRAERGHPR